jgi:hypothetical protein
MTEQAMDKLSEALSRIEARIEETDKLVNKLYEAVMGKDGDKNISSQGIIWLDKNTTATTYNVDPRYDITYKIK